MKIKVLGPVNTQVKMGKKGEYTVHQQEVTAETNNGQLRMTYDLDVESPSKGYATGNYDCDIDSQLKPGRYGIELPRFLKLTPAKA